MDAHKPAPPNEPPQRAKVWQPQSRIAGYIKGSVKLEEMVSREKLVRPEHRHNRPVFKALINDDDEPASATFVKCRNRSAISRCPSSSTKTSSLSRAGSVPTHQQLTADDLTRTIVEKNEHITALRDQLEALRSCARLEQLPEGGAEHNSLRVVLERMLECLLDMLGNLRHHDEHDERMAQFVAAVERERENVLRSVDALCRANSRKDEELRQMSGEQAQMRTHLQQLMLGKGGPSVEERRLCARNTDLVLRLRGYEQKYEKATEELRNLSSLAESVRKHIDAEKKAFDERTMEHKKSIDDLKLSYSKLVEEKEKRLAQLAKTHADEMAELRRQRAESVASVQQLRDEVQRVTSAEQRLQAENDALQVHLERVRQENEQIRDEIEHLKREKEALDTESKGTSDTDDPVRWNVNNEKMTFIEQDTQWQQLKRCLRNTVKRAGILTDDDVR